MKKLATQVFINMVGIPFHSHSIDTNVIVGYDGKIRKFSDGEIIGKITMKNIFFLFAELGVGRLKGKEELTPQ